MGVHRGYGLVERTIQITKQRLGVMLLEDNIRPIKLFLSTIIRDIRWNKHKTIQYSPTQAQFARLSKNRKMNLKLYVTNL